MKNHSAFTPVNFACLNVECHSNYTGLKLPYIKNTLEKKASYDM